MQPASRNDARDRWGWAPSRNGSGERVQASGTPDDLRWLLAEAGESDAEKRGGGCTRRVRLVGSTMVVNKSTGEVGFRDRANVRRELRAARGKDALAWITSHTFRKTAATILDEAALSARLVADRLGHSRPSMTQDVYMGRGAVDSQAALALEAASRDMSADRVSGGLSVGKEEGQTP